MLTIAIKTQAQASFLYYLLSNLDTRLTNSNQVAEHSLQKMNPPSTPRPLHRASSTCSSGIMRSLLGGLHREGQVRLDVTQVKCFQSFSGREE